MEKKPLASAAGCVIGLLLVYVLSIGPAAYLNAKGIIPNHFCEIVYWPLEPTTHISMFDKILNNYICWWVPIDTD